MKLEPVRVKSIDPDFQVPRSQNGEPMTLIDATSHGNGTILRYIGHDAVSSCGVDEVVVDSFVNQQGTQFLQITSRVIETPPPPPTIVERVRMALECLVGPSYGPRASEEL